MKLTQMANCRSKPDKDRMLIKAGRGPVDTTCPADRNASIVGDIFECTERLTRPALF